MFDHESPETTDDLVAGLAAQRDEIRSYFGALATGEFFAPQGEHWSPAEHLRHLNKCVRPVVQALKVPKLALWARFGRSQHGSRSYEAVVESYRQSLAEGATAGPFSPSERDVGESAEEWHREIVKTWDDLGQRLATAIE